MGKILVTGGAGFVGSHVVKKLVEQGDEIVIIDNLNQYYSPQLKQARLELLLKNHPYDFYRVDIADFLALEGVFQKHRFDKICHLAAQAGVRYSLENPLIYEQTNVAGTLHLLELAVRYGVKNFIFTSSSSVYGLNSEFPYKETHKVDSPVSLYAATKIAAEVQLHAYSHLHGLCVTILRLFNVYGPWVRPDLALFLFTQKISSGQPIDVYHFGQTEKDYTYIDDIVKGIVSAVNHNFKFEIINLGNSRPVRLDDYISIIEQSLGKKAKKNLLPLPLGDVPKSHADITKARELLGYSPKTSVDQGIVKFVAWYQDYREPLGLDRL